MTNFDTFLSTPQFSSFAPVAVSAERILPIDPSACVLNCRRAMEFAVKWMYSVDKALVMPYQDTLVSLMNTEDFWDIVGADIWRRMDLIRRMGNNAAHTGKKITQEQAALCLENLYVFLDFVAYCYGENYTEGHFDPALLTQESEASAAPVQEAPEVELAALMAENAALKEELTARRAEQQQTYVPKPLDLSEYKTRKLYIDTMLTDAGWTEGKDWLNEVELPGMPNKSEVGYADYVLYGDDGRPLAVVEAKRTCVDVAKGRQQAKLYADLLEKKYHRRPVIFLTNGFETRITDNIYPERKCAAIYSKRDLEKLFNLQTMRTSLKNVMVDQKIAGRYYQEGAIKAACDAFARNRRKALLVMATGSGKTRTVIALCDVLLQHGWVKNILFLADRNSLVTQAKRSFVNLLPDLSVTNLCEEKDNYTAHCVFSTYQTMYNVIDSVQDEEGKLFTCGHFDLVICDEAHRSVYNKYRDIFNYFDAPLVGLTATPKDEIDKNTYEIFELENGVPTYGYELAQAVKDGYVERYAEPDSYNALTYEDTLLMGQELAPLITPEEDDAKALRFDALMYGIELAYLAGKKYSKARSDLFKKVSAVASVANIPEIMAQAELIDRILHTDYVETAGINEFEHIRENLRDLIKYIPVSKVHYDTNFDDEILSVDWKESELENDDLKNYKAKAEFYVRQHMNDVVIAKLKSNVPLTAEDVQALEKALWNEVGTKQDYEAEYGQKPLGEFVREIVGLDMNAAKEAFAQYLNDASLDSRQIYFVNQIVEYIVHNGMMKDLSVLQEAPFTDHGSIVEVFTDLTVWMGIRNTIEKINSNAVA